MHIFSECVFWMWKRNLSSVNKSDRDQIPLEYCVKVCFNKTCRKIQIISNQKSYYSYLKCFIWYVKQSIFLEAFSNLVHSVSIHLKSWMKCHFFFYCVHLCIALKNENIIWWLDVRSRIHIKSTPARTQLARPILTLGIIRLFVMLYGLESDYIFLKTPFVIESWLVYLWVQSLFESKL